jgi:CBS domain containing-hemolysin-like protein
MSEEIIDRWIKLIGDTGADDPQTPAQHALLAGSKVIMNIATSLAFALVVSTAWLTLIRIVSEALSVDITNLGVLTTVFTFIVPLALAFRGAVLFQRLTNAARRWQVFSLIGIIAVLSGIARNLVPVFRCSVSAADLEFFLEAVAKLLADMIGIGELLALQPPPCAILQVAVPGWLL